MRQNLVISWVIYRLSAKSPHAATVAFSIVMGLLCTSSLGELSAQLKEQMKIRLARTPVVATTGDFEFELPTGWVIAKSKEQSPWHAVAIIVLESQVSDPNGATIQVDIGVPTGTPQQVAEGFTATKGHAVTKQVMVDGIESVHADYPTVNTTTAQLRHAVVIFKENRVYLIEAFATNNTDISGNLDHVIQTWKWKTKSP